MLERRVDEIGLYQLRAGGALINLVTVEASWVGRARPRRGRAQPRALLAACRTVRGRRLRAWLKDYGVVAGPVESRHGAEGQGLSMYLRDPEGNVVELKRATVGAG